MIRSIAPIALIVLAIVLAVLVLVLPTPTGSPPDPEAAQPTSGLLIENIHMISSDGQRTEPLSIIVRDGLIDYTGELADYSAPIPTRTIDGAGLTAIPGLIDSHTHSYGPALEDALRFGVTTSLDMFTSPDGLNDTRQAREDMAPTRHSDLFSAGMLATSPGGHGTQFGVPIETLTAPEQATSWVAARKAEGSDYVKLVYIPGATRISSLDEATAKAVIDAAHAEGLLALAHISTHDAASEMIDAGIDGLVHVFADKAISDTLLAKFVDNGVFVTPTLTVIGAVNGDSGADALASKHQELLSSTQRQTLAQSFANGDIPGFSLDLALQNVARLHEAGVPILAGSDAPNPGTAHGLSLHAELKLLVRAGLAPTAALDAATQVPARLFGLEGRGQISKGARADLLLVDGNPIEDIGAAASIRYILKNGQSVERAVPEAPIGTAIASDLFGDFETGMTSMVEFEWTASTDDMAGGASEVRLSRVEDGAQGSAYSLRIDASVNSGFPFPWSGVSVALAQTPSARPIDISDHTTISFDMKGNPGSYRVMAFGVGAQGIPPTQIVTINETWQTYTLQISDFVGLPTEALIGFAFVAGPAIGNSTIYLDNVKLVK